MSICKTVQTQKWYYLCNMRSAYFPINRRLHRQREREAMSICETVKTHKWYCLHNRRSGYFPIIRTLHREREREGERERVRERARQRERLCPYMKWWKHRNSTIYIIQDLDISLSIGNCIEQMRERESKQERERAKERERGYVHLWNGKNMVMVLSL